MSQEGKEGQSLSQRFAYSRWNIFRRRPPTIITHQQTEVSGHELSADVKDKLIQRTTQLAEEMDKSHQILKDKTGTDEAGQYMEDMYARIVTTLDRIVDEEHFRTFSHEFRRFVYGTVLRSANDDDIANIVGHPLRLAACVGWATDLMVAADNLDIKAEFERQIRNGVYTPEKEGGESYLSRLRIDLRSMQNLDVQRTIATQEGAEQAYRRFGEEGVAQYLFMLSLIPYIPEHKIWGMDLSHNMPAILNLQGEKFMVAKGPEKDMPEEYRLFGLYMQELNFATRVFCKNFGDQQVAKTIDDHSKLGWGWSGHYELLIGKFAGGKGNYNPTMYSNETQL